MKMIHGRAQEDPWKSTRELGLDFVDAPTCAPQMRRWPWPIFSATQPRYGRPRAPHLLAHVVGKRKPRYVKTGLSHTSESSMHQMSQYTPPTDKKFFDKKLRVSSG